MYASVYVPHLPLQAILRAEPALRAYAVAITEGKPPLCKVTDANQKARRAGIKLGMSKLEAAQLPDLMIRRRSPVQEAASYAALLDLGFAFSPRVESTAPDIVVLDLAGLEHLFGAPATIARSLVERASELGFKTQIGVAANIDAAVHASRGFRGITVIPEGLEAEVLGSLPLVVLSVSPESLETLERWGVRTFYALAALPTAQFSERLGQEGVRLQAAARGCTSRPLIPVEPPLNFEEVMELEYPVTMLEPLAFILGRMLDQLCQRLEARSLATNELRLQLELENVAPDLEFGNASHSPTASPSSSSLESVRQHNCSGDVCIAGLGGSITSAMRTPPLQRVFPVVTQTPPGRARGVSGSSESRMLRLPVPARDSKLLLKLWMLNLKADPPQAPVLKMALAAEPAKPRVTQGGLFLPLAPDPEKLEVTLARIAGVVGKERVGSPELEDSHRPDAFRVQRFNASAPRIKSRKTRIASPDSQEPKTQSPGPNTKSPVLSLRSRNLMALRIFRPPQPAVVEIKSGCPVRVFARRIRGDVLAASGPWRTSGNWWRDGSWAEDEWDVEIRPGVQNPLLFVGEPVSIGRTRAAVPAKPPKSGKQSSTGFYRIYRELASGNWFIRGMYD